MFWFVTAPSTCPPRPLSAGYKPNLANGETIFTIGGCVSCHKTPGPADRLELGGGLGLASPFGTFYAPNISPDRTTASANGANSHFVNALLRGVGQGRRAPLSGAALHFATTASA